MERFLIAISLGPVQSLIGAARRTRDLWGGSWLLSEAARAAARVLHAAQPGCLIFPCPDHADSDLLPQDQPEDAANIANILRAEVDLETPQQARERCEQAKHAAAARAAELGKKARKKMSTPLREAVWQAQIDDILEVFSAWTVLTGDGDYADASRRLGEALAARKATRDFHPFRPLAAEDGALRKSSLDGARETVLPQWPKRHRARHQLRLSDGEQLDALGVIKRLAGDPEQFTSYLRIAADAWLQRLGAAQQRRLRTAYEPLVGQELATRTSGNAGIYATLPYDGSLLYGFRLRNALAQTDLSDDARRGLQRLRACVECIADGRNAAEQPAGVPVPYAAILKADGDRMGKLLGYAASADDSRRISRALHLFASDVQEIVRQHRGHAIYVGGDDVLALLPLASALDCAQVLADKFEQALGVLADEMKVPVAERPTLSAGIGIGHVLEPMAALRHRAERAEARAKGNDETEPRNALAILLGIRSGAEIGWRAQWCDQDAFAALRRFAEAYREQQLPARAAYDLRAIDLRLAWLRDDAGDQARGMREAEVHRMLESARLPGGEQRIPSDMRELIRRRATDPEQSLRQLADTLIIARWLAARTAGDVGERP